VSNTDRRQFAPAAGRNRDPILQVLQRVLPERAHVLEIASGSGEHAAHFARHLPAVRWRASDPDADARASIAAWIAAEELANVAAPIDLDVRADRWPIEDQAPFDALVSINMVHIAPWEATRGLMAGAGRIVRGGGVLYLYGPFMRDRIHTAPSNESFDAWLKAKDASFGVRDLADIEAAAGAHGFGLSEIIDMPANNLSLVFVKA
jgi:cyclopropane fatty-acyl-phospholipid synthase-like methyltransferase